MDIQIKKYIKQNYISKRKITEKIKEIEENIKNEPEGTWYAVNIRLYELEIELLKELLEEGG